MHRICAKRNYVFRESVFISVIHFSAQSVFISVTHFSAQSGTLTCNKMIFFFVTKIYCLWCGVGLHLNSVLFNPLDSKLYFSLRCTAMLVPVHQIHKKLQGFYNNFWKKTLLYTVTTKSLLRYLEFNGPVFVRMYIGSREIGYLALKKGTIL